MARATSAREFPFQAGDATALRGFQWLMVLAAVAVGTALLLTAGRALPSPWNLLLPPLLFCAVPLIGLRLAAGSAWTALFHRLRWTDVKWMLAIASLNLIVTVLLGLLVSTWHHMPANPVFATLGAESAGIRALGFVVMVPQLLGEELLTILPFLACLWLLHTRLQLRRGVSLVLAWLLSAIPFALVHLPTYQWDVVQCLVIIGGARLVLSLAYLKTRNLWVCTGAHVINDWVLIGVGLAIASSH